MRAFHAAWEATLEHDDLFRDSSNRRLQIFGGHTSMPEERERQSEVEGELAEAHARLAAAWQRLMAFLHERYVEIDLAETGAMAAESLRAAFGEGD